jgi:HEAT repeat protein
MKRTRTSCCLVAVLLAASGCSREQQGPILAGGREVKSWLADLHDPKPQVRRQAVLKLGNVGDTDPSVAEGLAEALSDTDALVRRAAVLAVAKLTKPGETIMSQLKAMSEGERDTLARDYAKKAIAHFEKTQ